MSIPPHLAIVIGARIGSRFGFYIASFRLLLKLFNWQMGYNKRSSKHKNSQQKVLKVSKLSLIVSGFDKVYKISYLVLRSYLLGGIIGALLTLIFTRHVITLKDIPSIIRTTYLNKSSR